jgi:hypothetical protein
MLSRTFALGLVLSVMTFASSAMADYTTVNIDAYVNRYITIHPETMPIGLSNGNQGTGIPFDVSASPQNAAYSGIWLSNGIAGNSLTVDLSSFNITGQASFYALLNNFYGTSGVNEYNITISSATQSITYASIGNVDTRDYNTSTFTNLTPADTTTAWFDNGIGQRYDVRSFELPASFFNDIITSFTITQVQAGDHAVFAGLTFSTLPIGAQPVSEPSTWMLMLIGIAGLGIGLRRQRRIA